MTLAVGTRKKNLAGGYAIWDGRGWNAEKPTINKPSAPSSSSSSSRSGSGNRYSINLPGSSGSSGGRSLNLPGSTGSTFDTSGVNTGHTATSGVSERNSVIASSNANPVPAAYRAPEPMAPKPLPAPATINMPAPVPIAAPIARNPYANLANPYTGAYRDALISQRRGSMMQEFGDAKENIRRSFAERGLSQGGTSGMEKEALIRAEMAQANSLGQLNAQAAQQTTDAATQFELAKAAGDLQGMQFLESVYGNRQLLPRQLAQMDLANQRGELLMPYEVDGARLANVAAGQGIAFDAQMQPIRIRQGNAQAEGLETANAVSKQEAEMYKTLYPELVQAKLAEYKQAISEGRLAQWEAENAHWLGILRGGFELTKVAIGELGEIMPG